MRLIFRWFTALCVASAGLLPGIVALAQIGTAGAVSPVSDSTEATPKLFRVVRDNKIGYIDASAKLVIPFQFGLAHPFREGRAYVRFNVKCGYIDTRGQVVFAEKRFCSDLGWEFYEGLAVFEFETKRQGESYQRHRKRGYFDTNGNIIIPPRFYNAGDFHEGLAAANDKPNSKFGFIDKTGQYVIPPRFDYATDFSEGLAAVMVDGKTGYIDRSGKMVIPAGFDEHGGRAFHEGVALVALNGKLGAIDRTGRFIVPPQHSFGRDCSEGLIPFSDGPVGVRYYDVAGNVEIEGDYHGFGKFSEGLAVVVLGEKWGYINRKGEVVIPLQFDLAMQFDGGLAVVSVDKGWSWDYIDSKGKIVWRGVPRY